MQTLVVTYIIRAQRRLWGGSLTAVVRICGAQGDAIG
jgi:hypothetical protein